MHVSSSASVTSGEGAMAAGWYQVNRGLGVVASCKEAAMPGCMVMKGYICKGAQEACHGGGGGTEAERTLDWPSMQNSLCWGEHDEAWEVGHGWHWWMWSPWEVGHLSEHLRWGMGGTGDGQARCAEKRC
eukprot:1158472-Pelagomonas_calceolata.AAC.5